MSGCEMGAKMNAEKCREMWKTRPQTCMDCEWPLRNGPRPVAEPEPEVPEVPQKDVPEGQIRCICGCGRIGKHSGRGLVVACYHRHLEAGTLEQFPKTGKVRTRRKTPPEPPKITALPSPDCLRATIPQGHPCLVLKFETPRDLELLENLKARAEYNRRTLEAEVLWMIGTGLKCWT